MARQLVSRTSNALAAFGQFCIRLIKEQALSVLVELFLRVLCVHEVPATLNAYDPSRKSTTDKTLKEIPYLSGKVTRLNLQYHVVSHGEGRSNWDMKDKYRSAAWEEYPPV